MCRIRNVKFYTKKIWKGQRGDESQKICCRFVKVDSLKTLTLIYNETGSYKGICLCISTSVCRRRKTKVN